MNGWAVWVTEHPTESTYSDKSMTSTKRMLSLPQRVQLIHCHLTIDK